MENSKEQNILGVITDNKLNFKRHISELYKKAFSENCSFI